MAPTLPLRLVRQAIITGTVSYTIPAPVDPVIGFANLQWPASGTIEPLQEFNVYAQAWIENTTGSGTATEDLQAGSAIQQTILILPAGQTGLKLTSRELMAIMTNSLPTSALK